MNRELSVQALDFTGRLDIVTRISSLRVRYSEQHSKSNDHEVQHKGFQLLRVIHMYPTAYENVA